MNLKNIVDKILRKELKGEMIETGMGREVHIFKKIVVKVPISNTKHAWNGFSQNKTEFEVYTETATDMLCPILLYYKDCIVMERIENHPDNFLGGREPGEFIQDVIQENLIEVIYLCNKFDLNIFDIKALDNWGYNKHIKRFQLLDYGLKKEEITQPMDMF